MARPFHHYERGYALLKSGADECAPACVHGDELALGFLLLNALVALVVLDCCGGAYFQGTAYLLDAAVADGIGCAGHGKHWVCVCIAEQDCSGIDISDKAKESAMKLFDL